MQTAFERILATFPFKQFHMHQDSRSDRTDAVDHDTLKRAEDLLKSFKAHLAQRDVRPD